MPQVFIRGNVFQRDSSTRFCCSVGSWGLYYAVNGGGKKHHEHLRKPKPNSLMYFTNLFILQNFIRSTLPEHRVRRVIPHVRLLAAAQHGRGNVMRAPRAASPRAIKVLSSFAQGCSRVYFLEFEPATFRSQTGFLKLKNIPQYSANPGLNT